MKGYFEAFFVEILKWKHYPIKSFEVFPFFLPLEVLPEFPVAPVITEIYGC